MLTEVSKDHKLTQGLAYILGLFVYFLSSFKKSGGGGGGSTEGRDWEPFVGMNWIANFKKRTKGSQC